MKPGHLIFIFALLQCGIAFLTDGLSFTHEESMWHYIGRNWFRLGLTPYDGGVDNKSPLIFAVFGLSDLLFGLNYWFPRLLGIACQSAGIYFLYKIALHLARPQGPDRARQTAIITMTIYGLSLLWRVGGGKYVSFTETYAVTFLIMAFYYYLSGDRGRTAFQGGLLAGLALGWRLSACFGILAILIHSLFKQKKSFVPFAGGLIAALVVLALLAVAAGISLHDIYLYAFAENFGSGSTTDHSLAWKLENFTTSFFYSELLLFYPPVLGYFFMRKQHGLLAIWLACEFIGINLLGIYARPHFKHLLPVLSLISGISLAHLVNGYGFSMKQLLIALWILFIPKVTEPFTALKKILIAGDPDGSKYCSVPFPKPDERAEKKLGQLILGQTRPTDRVLVAGYGARVQLYAERLSPSVYFNVTQTARAGERFMQDVITSKPALVAIPVFPDYKVHVREDLRAFIDTLVSKEYVFVNCAYGYGLYRRR